MNRHQWIVFGLGFLLLSYISFFVIPKEMGLLGIGALSNFIILALISGSLGIIFIFAGLFENHK